MEKRIRMNISVTKKENTLIKKLAKEEERPYSRQIVYMTNFYIENNKLRGIMKWNKWNMYAVDVLKFFKPMT